MTVREVLQAAREAAAEIRRIEEQTELKMQAIGVQGYSYGVHGKSGVLDPMRRVIDLVDWREATKDTANLWDPINDGYEILAGIEKITDPLTTEIVARYWLQAETWNSIARDLGDVRHIKALEGLSRASQVALLVEDMDALMDHCERIGIAHLRDMGGLH